MALGPYEKWESAHAGHLRYKAGVRSARPWVTQQYYCVSERNGKETNLMNGTSRAVLGHARATTIAYQATVDTSSAAYRKAFDRFTSKITDNSGTAGMGVTIAEARSSFEMISNRSQQLVTAINSIRKRDFGSLMKALNLSRDDRRGRIVWRRQTRKGVVRDAASNLLEYTFGWVPMVNDMIAALRVLSSTPKPLLLVGRGKDSFTDTSDNRWEDHSPQWLSYRDAPCDVDRKVQILGRVLIMNPNLDLANRMGLANPIQLAWQVIPYSFLVDQFFGISQFLGRWSAMYGRSLENTAMSQRITATSKVRSVTIEWGTMISGSLYEETVRTFTRQPISSLPIPTVLPYFRLPTSDLLGRAVTSVALLLQRMKR